MMPAPMTATRILSRAADRSRPASAASIARPRRARRRRAPAPCQTIRPDRQLAGVVAGQAEGAAVEQVDAARVAQQKGVGGEERSSSSTSGASGGATIGTVGERRASKACSALGHARDPVAARGDEVDVVGGAHRLAAPDAQGDARVVLGLALGQPAAVPGPALGRREAAGGVDRRDLGQGVPARSSRSARRPPTAPRDCASKARATVASRPSSTSRVGTAKRHARAAALRQRTRPAGEHLVQDDRVAHRARDRRDGVERRRQRHRAVDRHQPRRALEADQALQRGRDADRAAGVGAERGPGGAGGDRRRRRPTSSRRGCAASGRAPSVAGLAGVPEVRIDADAGERELGHVGVADRAPRRRARRRATAGASATAGGASAQDRRAGGGGLAGDVEQVLDRDGQAGERARVAPGGDRRGRPPPRRRALPGRRWSR